jgi:hypothetical protein
VHAPTRLAFFNDYKITHRFTPLTRLFQDTIQSSRRNVYAGLTRHCYGFGGMVKLTSECSPHDGALTGYGKSFSLLPPDLAKE